MPLSKERMKALSQQRRDVKRQTYDKPIKFLNFPGNVRPKDILNAIEYLGDAPVKSTMLAPVEPIIEAISPSVRRDGYGKASSTVQPETIEEQVKRLYPDGLPNCRDGRYR